MKSAVEKLSPTKVKLQIEVTFEEMKPHIDRAYKSISETVNIPGFRKGKVPAAMIDQRVGRSTVLNEALNPALTEFWQRAVIENKVAAIGRPSIDITSLEDNKHLHFSVEVEVRPEIELPDFSKMTISVDDVVVTDADIDEQVEGLRIRFGTLTPVEKVVEKGDFVTIDLVAKVNGEVIEGGVANGISYEVGGETMLDGLDDALIGLSANESKVFQAELAGAATGELGDVEVTVKEVKRRDLPELNDEFAKTASEFETLAELREDLAARLKRVKAFEQGAQARDKFVEELIATVAIELPEGVINDEVETHLEQEGRQEDAEHRAEVTESSRKNLTTELILDAIVSSEDVQPTEAELSEYIVRTAARYGMAPDQFVQEISNANQISVVIAEVTRTKALAVALSKVTVKDASGNIVDLEALRPQAPAEAEAPAPTESIPENE